MIDSWKNFLQSQGAAIEGSAVLHYGDPAAERAVAMDGTIVADLSQLGVIALRGEDTATFLQGQLTNDVRALHADGAQWSGYCSPKGRLLGNFLAWRQGEDFCLQLSGDILPGVLKRLSMFIMRAKVQGRDASDENVRLVVAGKQALAAVTAAMGAVPDTAMRSVAGEAGQVIRLGDDKFVLSIAPERAAAVWQALRPSATPVGAPVWDWLRLNAGIPMIVAATQEQFVPQMVNLEAIGGVSFQKGCYPGQEIVARSQYLGKLKRRMFLAHVDAEAAPGDSLYSADIEGQATGTVVNAAPAPAGGYDVLAVAQVESANAQTLHLKAADGAALILKPLPYALPE
ncbi:YgfZ/GcvT domain-containing protein [Thiobacillus denitrificans]|uniref:Glycine cleavage system protein T n=1 Tax=Thiobacillus denitrificans TaxID=36861 RepID=A0A106BVT3_THIDE|nr:folate-binding protein YgfZ [Thiobacillus denitrificans]KVW99570.1 glycine cleavage system protein T [Thiobacillus denitrificans]